ncbi:GNAT family N-acetyltransferase [Maricaulis parjimensis]|uniref:GNAT family N-acetyltransferase n=1 Tax=Maricaulis parjimensis TaxID=144023 RepID=UPI00193A2937|nr:N-acetyltransferase [Maricaulis parjimensis]
MQIRAADEADYPGIDSLLKSAFPGPEEARLVVCLRAADQDTLELVAEDHGRIVGTIFFSPVQALSPAGTEFYGIGLAPMAVTAEHQKRGIGSALIEHGLTFLTTLGVPWCVVLGDPAYYSRSGFQPASVINWRWDGDPEGDHAEAFMIKPLGNHALPDQAALVSYHPAFETV